ncbi:hypothetical protein V2J97_25835 [Pseudomonas alliivorans]|nr:hypothetical protein [Pseudomonas alliivorans]
MHLTFYETYKRCADAIGVRIDATPSLIETDVNAIVASGSWYWKNNNIGAIADDASLEVDLKVRRVTAKINTGLDQLAKRKAVGKEIIQLINNDFWGGVRDELFSSDGDIQVFRFVGGFCSILYFCLRSAQRHFVSAIEGRWRLHSG